MIASSFPLPSLETQCTHDHPTFKGKRDHSGNFISQQTSCYPIRMANQIAHEASHLVTSSKEISTWEDALSNLPVQSPMPHEGSTLPCADGGGIASNGDWTSPRGSDLFADLRRAWLLHGLQHEVLKNSDPLASINFEQWLSTDFIQNLRDITSNFFASHGLESQQTIPEGQPFLLTFMRQFAVKSTSLTLFRMVSCVGSKPQFQRVEHGSHQR